jgi:drug/metabolite transporter (DMT)-like permease
MNPGYLYTLAGLLSFGTLGILHKIADVKKCRPEAVNALIYGWSLLFSILTVTVIQHSTPAAPAPVIWIAIPFGVSASIAILAFQAGIRHGDIATSWLAINLSSGIPTVASILIYDEPLSLLKTVALLLIPVSMSLLWIDKRKRESAETNVDRSAGEPVVIRREDAK